MLKIYIKTFGCQANVRDSEALLGLFLARGYKAVNDPVKADVVLANTCSVRALAENKARSFLGEFQEGYSKPSHRERPLTPSLTKRGDRALALLKRGPAQPGRVLGKKKIIGLVGCMARNEGKRLFQHMAHVDLICSPGVLEKIPGYVEEILESQKSKGKGQKHGVPLTQDAGHKRLRIIDLEDRMRDEAAYAAAYRAGKNHASVVISTGCANSCTYCIVPYVRGKLRLRKPEDIVAEVRAAVKNGATKITLLGQNVNDYNYVGARSPRPGRGNPAPTNFIDLLKMVAAIPGVEEIDFVSSNPKNTSRELFEFMAASKKMKKIINLPFQSGSNKILKAMNRGYTRAQYLALVKEYKRIVGGQVSTDIIVGFPGETEADFKATMDVVKECKFDMAYIFKYSPRPHTFAADLSDSVEQLKKEYRNNMLLDLQKQVSKTA